MELRLIRDVLGEDFTEGNLYVDGDWECFTLEDVVRGDGEKIPGDTAIPAGRYRVIVNRSPHFNRDLPLLLKVPNFEGVRIHPGNTSKDTEGCILVGQKRIPGMIQGSRLAFDPLFSKIQTALIGGEVWITIE